MSTDPAAVVVATPVPAAVVAVAGSDVVAAELVARATAELPSVAELGERERLLVSAWLSSLRSARTRRAYLQRI